MGMTWKQICADPIIAEWPYKVESDEWGNAIMSPPPGSEHSNFQGQIILLLGQLLPPGHAQPEFPLQTSKGVKAVDAIWVSRERRRQKPKGSIVHLIAPEICVEILSPKNKRAEIDQKKSLYFEKGAQECWICDRKGRLSFFDPSGQIPRSRLCPDFPLQLESED
jgi:Uma2 family endonuclease